MSAPSRHYAGVVVTADPGRFAEAVAQLRAIAGVEVHHTDPPTGRCVAVLESGDRAGQEALFARLSALPWVRSTDLVYHLVDREPESGPAEEPSP